MIIPNIFGDDFLDSFFDDLTRPVKSAANGHGFANMPQVLPQVQMYSMKTDIRETDEGYEFDMDLPGCAKEDIKAELSDGYLTVTAQREAAKEEADDDKKYIRRERYMGTCKRAFYVGELVKQEDVKAKFDNGVLKLFVPKKEEKPVEETKEYINID